MASRKREASADGGIGAGPAVLLRQASADMEDTEDQEKMAGLHERVRARLEKDLDGDRADHEDGDELTAVVGDPKWDVFTGPDGERRKRVSLQGHLGAQVTDLSGGGGGGMLHRAKAVADRLARAARLRLPLEQAAVADGRAYWRLAYEDGTVHDERSVDWPELPRAGRRYLTLVAPDGTGNTIDAGAGQGDRLFQFHCAEVRQRVTIAPTGPVVLGSPPDEDGVTSTVTRPRTPAEEREAREFAGMPARVTTAHVIGLILDGDGACGCLAWEPHPTRRGAGRWVRFEDNVLAMRYRDVGAIATRVLGAVDP